MANELIIIDKQNLSAQEIEELDAQIDSLIERHKNNRAEINRLVLEGTTALTAGDKLSQDMNSQKRLKRFWKRFSGGNNQTQNEINADIFKAQYAAQETLQKLAEQNLLSFELIAVVNNRLNASMLEVNEEIIGIKSAMVEFFSAAKEKLIDHEERISRLEHKDKLQDWTINIKILKFDGVRYKDLDDITKIVCIVRDFWKMTGDRRYSVDFDYLETALDNVGLDPDAKISYENFIRQVAANSKLYTYLLKDTAQFATEYETLAFDLKTIAENENFETFNGEKIFQSYDLILELLYNLEQLEYNKKIHEKLQEAKNLFLSCKIKEALPLLKETADAGKDEARYMLSVIYKEGLTVEKNPEYATLLATGTIAEENPDTLKKTADSGDVFAQYKMAQYHLKAAMNYLSKSAAQNYFLALVALNVVESTYNFSLIDIEELKIFCEEKGNHYDRCENYTAALNFYHIGEFFGDIQCTFKLGIYYEHGQGVSKNYAEAIKHYKQAIKFKKTLISTDNLYDSIQKLCALNICRIYLEGGYGVAQDLIMEMDWKDVYSGYKEAVDLLERDPY